MTKISKREYSTIHTWRWRNCPKKGVCEHCNAQTKTQWSNKTGKYIRDDDSDWQELCQKCHYNYDRNVLKVFDNVIRKNQEKCTYCLLYRKLKPYTDPNRLSFEEPKHILLCRECTVFEKKTLRIFNDRSTFSKLFPVL
jgi:hypothetical protein